MQGDIRVRGIHTASLVAGGLDFCHEMEWRAVCEGGWNDNDARVVCRQLGFSLGECNYLTFHSTAIDMCSTGLGCVNSCFGRSSLAQGVGEFNCGNNGNRLG